MIKQTISGEPYVHELISITFELTYACDKKCSYCYNPIPRYNGVKTNIKDEIWQKIMSIETPLQVLLLGGETTFFKHTSEYWNEYCTKYMTDTTKHINLYTHGNNKPEEYDKYVGGKRHAFFGFSYHPGQTDEDLYFENIKRMRARDVNIVVCLVISADKSTWTEGKEILRKVTELGCRTQIEFCVTSDNLRDATADAYEFFDAYLYKCYKIKELIFEGDEALRLPRDHYNRDFVAGLSDIKKFCKNRVYKITADGIMKFECDLGGQRVDLKQDINAFDRFILPKTVTCEQRCTGIASTLNEKVFFAKTIDEIRG